MGWGVYTETRPVARKDYPCDACESALWAELNYPENIDKEDFEVMENAKADGYRILKGMKYIKVCGLYEGNWTTFRARIGVDEICHKYEAYPEY